MNIDKYKYNKHGFYYDEDGTCYETADEFIQCKMFGFCNCGDPELSLEFVRRALQQVSNLEELVWKEKQTHKEWDEITVKQLGSKQAMYFAWYWLHEKNFTEHGGSVPGWLTDEGRNLLQDLNEILKTTK